MSKLSLKALLQSLLRDFSLSAVVAALIAVTVGYAGPAVIIFQAAKIGHLSEAQLSSWIWAISIGSGITSIALSLRYKVPVITAWSTPGAALLVAGLAQYSYAEAIGAYLLSATLLTLFGVTGLFSKVMGKLPKAVVAAMLAGILFRFGIELFVALEKLPLLVLPIVLVYLLAKRLLPRYAVILALLVGLSLSFGMGRINFHALSATLATPVLTTPSFSLAAMIGLGIPLFFVTMASQNAPGVAVLQNAGYTIPISPLISSTGLASLLLAPFGAHGINLAAITAAICTGSEAHSQIEKRYVAGVVCGLLYLLIAAFGSMVASVFSALPDVLIASLAGLALMGALGNGLGNALQNENLREPGLITFLITASGISFFGIGAPFWGLMAGVTANLILAPSSK